MIDRNEGTFNLLIVSFSLSLFPFATPRVSPCLSASELTIPHSVCHREELHRGCSTIFMSLHNRCHINLITGCACVPSPSLSPTPSYAPLSVATFALLGTIQTNNRKCPCKVTAVLVKRMRGIPNSNSKTTTINPPTNCFAFRFYCYRLPPQDTTWCFFIRFIMTTTHIRLSTHEIHHPPQNPQPRPCNRKTIIICIIRK